MKSNKAIWLKRAALMAVWSLLSSCGGGSSSEAPPSPVVTTPPPDPPSGLWINSSPGEGIAAYKNKLTTLVNTERAVAFADSAPAQDGAGSGYSTTYTLEPNTDEYDIVKYDGSTLAIAPSRSGGCFIL